MMFRLKSFAAYNALFLSVGALVLLAIVAAAFVFSGRAQDEASEALRSARVDRLALEFISDLVDAETAQRGFIITGKETYLEPYVQAMGEFEKDSEELRQRVAEIDGGRLIDPAEVEALIAAGRRKMDLIKNNLAEVRAGHMDEARRVIASDAGKLLMDDVRRRGQAIRETAANRRILSAARMREAAAALTTMITLGAGLIVVLAIGATLLVRRHMQEIDQARQDLVMANEGLEERVRERTQGVMQANEELQRYAYIISHDLRAPLVNIMGFTAELDAASATIREHVPATPDAADDGAAKALRVAVYEDIPEALGFIRSSMKRMDALINEILKLSRAGRRVLEPETIDVQQLVEDCVTAIHHRFDDVGAGVSYAGRLPAVVSDRAALQQIFTNLLDNAAKYLVEGRPGRIVVRGSAERWRAVFEVEDNGRGIDASDHERVFELFRRAGPQDRPGDGIGLAHTRMLARRLGGDVTVVSDGTSGTIFRVTIARDLAAHIRRGET